MLAYLCTYRHSTPSISAWRRTEEVAVGNPFLRRYLDAYQEPQSFLDWGDDPSFFASSVLLGDTRRSTWGVCRRDVRDSLSPGDFVVFVCARESAPSRWDYYFVGVATLADALDRETIWSNRRYVVYRDFLNVLARPGEGGSLIQHEVVHQFHPDWRRRCDAPYWLFDPDNTLLHAFNPTHVATYDGRLGSIEWWRTDEPRIEELRSLLLRGTPTTRGLRSTNAQRAHPKLPLARGYPTDSELRRLRTALLDWMGG